MICSSRTKSSSTSRSFNYARRCCSPRYSYIYVYPPIGWRYTIIVEVLSTRIDLDVPTIPTQVGESTLLHYVVGGADHLLCESIEATRSIGIALIFIMIRNKICNKTSTIPTFVEHCKPSRIWRIKVKEFNRIPTPSSRMWSCRRPSNRTNLLGIGYSLLKIIIRGITMISIYSALRACRLNWIEPRRCRRTWLITMMT